MSADAKPAVHPAAQEHLDSFCERIDAGTTDMAAWLEHALEHGKRALHAVYQPRFALSEFVESAGEATAEQEAGKLFDDIAKEAE